MGVEVEITLSAVNFSCDDTSHAHIKRAPDFSEAPVFSPHCGCSYSSFIHELFLFTFRTLPHEVLS